MSGIGMSVTADREQVPRQGVLLPPDGGSTPSFAVLFESVIPDLILFLCLRCEASEVDDVAADIMAEVYSHWNLAPADLEAQRMWGFGFARNKVREFARRRKQQSKVSERTVVNERTNPEFETIIAGNDRVIRLLSLLPDKESEVIQLTIFGGFSCSETAQILGVSTTAVTTRAARARQHLKRIILNERSDS